jgi:hypothetical protein
VEALKVHCLLHSYQLARDVRKRRQIYQDTQSFSKVLREKEDILRQKERSRKTDVDVDSVMRDIEGEKSRWERNWTSIKGEWVLDTLKTSLSPSSSTDFFSQSYEDAFANNTPSSTNQFTPSIIQQSSSHAEESISSFVTIEKDLAAEMTRLEGLLGHNTPPRRSSLRKSLPPTMPSPSPSAEKTRTNGYNLRFSRSVSRLSRSASESPRSSRTLAPEHSATQDLALI